MNKTPLPTHQRDAISEQMYVSSRFRKMDQFIQSDRFSKVHPEEQNRLRFQHRIMKLYLEILNLRISVFEA